MTDYYVDFVNGNDANGGTSWVDAKATISNLTAPGGGDRIKVAKTVDPATLTQTCTGVDEASHHKFAITLNSALDIDYINGLSDTWGVGVAANGAAITRTNFASVPPYATSATNGERHCRITLPTTPVSNTKYAYWDLGGTVDLSSYEGICGWFGVEGVSHANNADFLIDGFYTIKLCSDTTGDTPVATLAIPQRYRRKSPGVSTLNMNAYEAIKLFNGGALPSNVQSIALYTGTVDAGWVADSSHYVYMSWFYAMPANPALLPGDWISINGSDQLFPVAVIEGPATATPVVFLDPHANTNGFYNDDMAPYHLEETGSIQRWRVPDPPWWYTQYMTVDVTDLNCTGASGNPLVISGGWDVNTNTQNGLTFFDFEFVPGLKMFETQSLAYGWYEFENFVYAAKAGSGSYALSHTTGTPSGSNLTVKWSQCVCLGFNAHEGDLIDALTLVNSFFGPNNDYGGAFATFQLPSGATINMTSSVIRHCKDSNSDYTWVGDSVSALVGMVFDGVNDFTGIVFPITPANSTSGVKAYFTNCIMPLFNFTSGYFELDNVTFTATAGTFYFQGNAVAVGYSKIKNVTYNVAATNSITLKFLGVVVTNSLFQTDSSLTVEFDYSSWAENSTFKTTAALTRIFKAGGGKQRFIKCTIDGLQYYTFTAGKLVVFQACTINNPVEGWFASPGYCQNVIMSDCQMLNTLFNGSDLPTADIADADGGPENWAHIHRHDNAPLDHKAFSRYVAITTSTGQLHGDALRSWKMEFIDTIPAPGVIEEDRFLFKVGAVALKSGVQFTASLWVYLLDADLDVIFKALPGTVEFAQTELKVNSNTGLLNQWQELTLQYTPTQDTVAEFHVTMTCSDNTAVAYFGDMSVTQV